MKIGAIFPQIEFPADPLAIIDYARAVEDMGYDHILAYEHVLGGDPDSPGGFRGPYSYHDPFFSPFLLFSYLAAVTDVVEFVTGILILPQRQTALVAKQAATLDVLSEGRFRMGVGIGWNPIEYDALDKDFHTRGARSLEQVELMQQLWSQPLVDFEGRWEQVVGAGIHPRPAGGKIPVWFGGHADAVMKRIAKVGDGWMPNQAMPADLQPQFDALDRYLEAEGRSMADIGIEFRVHYQDGAEEWSRTVHAWTAVGATHMTVNTMHCGLESVDEHLGALEEFMNQVG